MTEAVGQGEQLEPEPELCSECHGDQYVYVPITKDMARDAGAEEMEGYRMRFPCGRCGGDGLEP